MKSFTLQTLGLASGVVASVAMLVSQPATAAYPESCTVYFKLENAAYPNVEPSVTGSNMVITSTEGVITGTFPASDNPMNSALMYIVENDCPVEITEITIDDDDDGVKDILSMGAFDGSGATKVGNIYNFPTGAQPWAGFANETAEIYPVNVSGGGTVTITARTAPEEDPTPEECEVGVHFEEAFGGALYNAADCANPYYELPATGEDWGGFSDLISADGTYPYSFPYGGTLEFTCAGANDIYFKFEKDAYPDVDPSVTSSTFSCGGEGSRAAQTWDIPASDNEYRNFLMYVTKGAPAVLVNGVTVTAAAAPPPPPPAPPAAPATPVPALPFWALLGLAGLVGLFGFRRR